MSHRADLFDLVDEAFSPEDAEDVAISMTDHYRAPGTSGFEAAIDIVEEELRDAGLDVTAENRPIEGAWEPNEASLSVVEPDRERLIDFETAPACLAWTSSSTDGPEQLEVVDVGTGERPTDFEGRDVEDKAVFIHGTRRRPGWWQAARNAVDAGARGIITDYMLYQTPGVREPERAPEAAQLLRLRPREYFADEDVWAFSIPHEASEALRSYLERGPVTIEASVDVDVFDTETKYVEATIPGAEIPEETVLLCGHASGIRPGANCAEGTGLVVELARTFQELVDEGGFEPRRSITFIVGIEGPVSDHYLETHPDATENVVTSLTYCSTGHRQSETDSCLLLSASPDSVPHYVNDYLAELADRSPKEADWIGKEGGQELPLLNFKQHYYTPWSDNTKFAAAGIPAPLFISWPDRCFHSQFLTKDVIDPAALRRSALVSGVAALELSAADATTARSIARIVAGRSIERLHSVAADSVDPSDDRPHRQLSYIAERDVDALRSVGELTDEPLEATVDDLSDRIRRTAEAESGALPDVPAPDRPDVADLVPVRSTDDYVDRWAGLDYDALLEIADQLANSDDEAGWRSMRVVSDEAWNFVDGERTVGDIADAVGVEFDLRIDAEPIYRILAGHEEAGNLRFER